MQLWRYEGINTLQHYLQRKDCVAALALDLAAPKSAVVVTVLRQILEAASVSNPGPRCLGPLSLRHLNQNAQRILLLPLHCSFFLPQTYSWR